MKGKMGQDIYRIWASSKAGSVVTSHLSHLLIPDLRFLKLYGRRFSKEDHVLFVKLLYELVTLPNLEPHMMQSYARLLIQLLK